MAIYQAGIDTSNATFETVAPSREAFGAISLPDHSHVALAAGDRHVVGWVAASAVSDRCVYQGVVEHSVYVAPDAQGRGIGRQLLDALITSTETAGVWTIQTGIFPENTTSLRLHETARSTSSTSIAPSHCDAATSCSCSKSATAIYTSWA